MYQHGSVTKQQYENHCFLLTVGQLYFYCKSNKTHALINLQNECWLMRHEIQSVTQQ